MQPSWSLLLTGIIMFPHLAITHNQTGINHPETAIRVPRKIFHKAHSGVAFLTGFKLGSLFGKGLEATDSHLGQGSVASSHSFKLFGKTVNSALSLSYGDVVPFLPVVSELYSEPKAVSDNIVHVTVIENPSSETLDKLKTLASVREAEENEVEPDGAYTESNSAGTADTESNSTQNLFVEHNRRVQELNEQIKRRKNSRF